MTSSVFAAADVSVLVEKTQESSQNKTTAMPQAQKLVASGEIIQKWNQDHPKIKKNDG